MATYSKVTNAHRYAVMMSTSHPDLRVSIAGYIHVMYSEIDNGESPDVEAELLISSVDDLIESTQNTLLKL